MGRFLATFATLLILVLAAAFALPALIDWNEYRPFIEKTASGVLGRKVSILGDIDIVLLPEPRFRANNVAAGNGAKNGAMMTADSVDILLSLSALAAGRIEAAKVRLVRPGLTVDFAKPLAGQDPETGEDTPPLTAGVNSLEIANGRIAVFTRSDGTNEALSLTKINGTVSSSFPDHSYRFIGRLSQDGKPYDVKLTATPGPLADVKVTGTISDTESKATLQADGVLSAPDEPSFNGAITVNLPQQASGSYRMPFDAQLKSTAKLSLTNAVLADVSVTFDSQNRPQVLLGSANINFSARTAAFALQARSLDADGLLTAAPGAGIPLTPVASADWTGLRAAADRLLWLYPSFGMSLSFESDLMQLKGEPVEAVKIHGSRTGQRWVFEQAQANLPGESAFKLAGTVTKAAASSRLAAAVSVEGKYLSRLARWIAPSVLGASSIGAGAFALQGSLTLSEEAAALEGVTGSLDGTAFTASLRLDESPARKLTVSLAGEKFDLSAFEGAGGDAATRQPGLARLTALLGGDSSGFEIVDADISVGGIKTSAADFKNVAVHLKATNDIITVSKLSAETASGLMLLGEGAIPLRNAGQGRFDGRLEARSPQAILQAASLAGYDAGSALSARANYLAPAALSISYSSEQSAGIATGQVSGNLGSARVDGRAQLSGAISDWKTGPLAAQANLFSGDGVKLIGLLFPETILAPGASLSPGTLAIRLNGIPSQLQASASLSAGPLQVQLDGTGGLDGKSVSFKGKANASSQTPEQFLPAPLLALLGGEPKANLRVSTNLTVEGGRIVADALSADTPKTLVTGRLALDTGGSQTRVDANLRADQYSLPALLAFFLSDTGPDASALALPSSAGAPLPLPDVWSGKPFSLSVFQNMAGSVTLAAKGMKLGDAITLSDAQLRAKLDKGRLDIEDLKGRTFGGDFETSFSLIARGNAVAGEGDVTLSGADIAALAAPGTPPVITGKATLALSVAGQGLSPRGLISVLRGRGSIRLSDGQLARFSPAAVQKSAEELVAAPQPPPEETITKKILEASQSSDFSFRRLTIPVVIEDGALEIRRASFRGRDATVRMEALLDINKMQADSTWQMGVSSDRRLRWPPVKIQLAGPLRELGARPRTLAAEDLVRAILIRKMEGDLNRLEGLNKPAAQSQWTTSQEPASKQGKRRKRNTGEPADAAAAPGKPAPAAASAAPVLPQGFEKRMRDALDGTNSQAPR